MSSISVRPELLLERILSMEIVRVTERGAVAAAKCWLRKLAPAAGILGVYAGAS